MPTVDAVLDRYATVERRDCEAQANFCIGYLFRFNPKDASLRLSTMIQSPPDQCSSSVLGLLGQARYSDDLLPIAMQSLNAPTSPRRRPLPFSLEFTRPNPQKTASGNASTNSAKTGVTDPRK